MGWRDRDYTQPSYREEVFAPGLIKRPQPTTLTLMLVHGSAFVLLMLLAMAHRFDMQVWPSLSNPFAHPAGILLHPFATLKIMSALFVVLALWSLAGRVEEVLGGKRMLLRYGVGCLAAGAAAFGWGQALGSTWGAELETPVGGLAALLVAAATHLRFESASVLGRVMPVPRMYWIAAGIVVALRLVMGGAAAIPWVLTVGAGLLIGWNIERAAQRRPTLGGTARHRGVSPRVPTRRRDVAEPEIDDILDKISAQGMEALTDAERERLEAARRAKLRRR
jgi:membrane associated rhomboid family serine protease